MSHSHRDEIFVNTNFQSFEEDKEKLQELLHTDERFAKLSISASFLLNSVTNKGLNINPQKENFNMCKAIDDLIADATNEANQKIALLSSQNTALSSQNTALSSQNTALSSQNTALSSQNSTLSSENAVLKTENASLLSQIEMLQLELKRAKAQITN